MWLHEQTDADALGTQPAYGAHDDIALGGRPSALTRNLAGLHGDKRALRRPDFPYERDEVWTRVAFDVELDALAQRTQKRRNLTCVGSRDMPAVRARVHRDAGRPRGDTDENGVEYGRHGSAARVPDSGDFVDVDG